jgi:asparagine synthase (glutamine-hydrolysing)
VLAPAATMCGIAGVLYRDGSKPSNAVLKAMANTLAHRGPDGASVKAWPGGGFAHRRLSIIDLSEAAGQPMASPDGKTWVAFNGEIYNFLELRARLEALGHTFRTQGDTEVLLAAYAQWGEDCFAQLDGMFAVALWDTASRRLILARDRTGKKPLYVYEDGSKLLFASEIKAILAHADVDSGLSPEAVPQFLSHGYVPTPRTFYRRIRKLRPSTYEVLEWGQREPRAVQYWDIPVGPEREGNLDDIKAELRETFFAAVKRRLVSDVPLGAFLSGGVDSTLVVAAMAQSSSKRVKTFSIGFDGHPEWDETKWAAEVAQRYGCEHTEFKVKPDSFDLLEKLSWHYDEPFGDSSAIPTYIVSKLTREKVTVALTGDGGDELFCGYPRFMGALLAEQVPQMVRRIAGRVVGLVPHGQEHQGWYERGRRFADQAAKPLPERLRGWISIFPERDLHAILKPDVARFATAPVLGESYTQACKKAKGADTLNQVLYVNARTYLLDDLNVKMDRASMAASLEARAPFLDTKLMELAFRLPGSLKLKGRTMKWVLKEALGDLLPGDVATRKKMGFGVPLGAWFRGGLSEQLDARLLRAGARVHDFVRPMELRRLVAEHRAGHRDWGLQFFNLLMLELFLGRRKQPHSLYPSV